jgi:CubicO group peptidase (beta-lactamase class C family)
MRVIALILLVSFMQSVFAQSVPDVTKSLEISKSLSEIVASGKAPGLTAAVISGDGVIAIGSGGVRKVGTDTPVTTKDLVHLGSCTKAMTCTMLSTLVAEGKLSR